MSQPYKVRLPYHYDAALPITSINNAMSLCQSAGEWLRGVHREHHCVMVYDNEEQGVTFVFSDPDTATLFRLAH